MSSKLIVLSNRGPVKPAPDGEGWIRTAGGLVTALDPVLRERDSVWLFSAGTSEAAQLRSHPPEQGYALSAVELPAESRRGFYDDVANGVLWPLMHSFHPTVRVGEAPWKSYEDSNRRFAEAAKHANGSDAVVWIHDFHLMLVPGQLRAMVPAAKIGWFCHIPWPSPDLFSILPWRRQLLEGLLGADLLAFHTPIYERNFLECVERLTDCNVDHARRVVAFEDRITKVICAPIGVPVEELETLAEDEQVKARAAELQASLLNRRIILGCDRLDYTKGIPERILAYQRLLERHPKMADETVMVQVMVPSRTDVEAYASLKEEIEQLVGEVNGRFGTTGRVPIHYLFQHLERADIVAHYRAADVAMVTPLRDGMNLVAQEYVAARTDEAGVLVLSEFAGAAEYLRDAVMVNAYDVGGMCDALEQALAMSPEEAGERMRSMRTEVARLDVHTWANRLLELLEFGV